MILVNLIPGMMFHLFVGFLSNLFSNLLTKSQQKKSLQVFKLLKNFSTLYFVIISVWCKSKNILLTLTEEASSHDPIKMTQFRLEYDRKYLHLQTLTLEHDRKFTLTNINVGTWPKSIKYGWICWKKIEGC